MVEITEEEYKRLLWCEKKLHALEASGVDNWDWYGEAMELLGDYEDSN